MKYIIKIPKPCNEKWSEMSPTEKGAFCSNCKKEVLDFTNMSNYKIATLLDKNQEICGKFRPDQLEKNIQSVKQNRSYNIGLLLGVSALLSVANPVFSQNKKVENIRITELQNKINKKDNPKKVNDSIEIKGQIIDENGSIPGVAVVLKGHSYGTLSDFDGNFSINVKEEEFDKNAILIFSFIGFEVQEIKVYRNTEYLKVKMVEDNSFLGEVVIIKKQNIFRRIGNLFRKKDTEVCH
ncbi:carboxypeptidase-like regulatory domain-containing protein [Joostella atrarenae]|uniref:Carboxypeptidase-like regulatory domain-containing protein n=1 Tax=Joostella atrarenae TaxID=679257 RepID=A0ABS9J443_9FLAO|nr:carboxypeptidase-like regulatory domain-containing protein [Joostella atrarenae]MCF8715193.1 carboxypeptidase-like regulatory domain-containing protein [Joostella atrarenae]